LLKAIDEYIAKADYDLIETLNTVGFVEASETVSEISTLETQIVTALKSQTAYVEQKLNDAVDLNQFRDELPAFRLYDDVDKRLAEVFLEEFQEQIPLLATAYAKQIDSSLAVTAITKRTIAWIDEWSEELGKIMKLSTHEKIECLLTEHLYNGNSVAEFTQAIMESGIRDEYYRARTTAVTEMLRAHSTAQQEAIMQNPACSFKQWVHSGSHQNNPRDNHVRMNGIKAPKSQPFSLEGADGNLYFPMYPRATNLPPSESINCHCIHQGIVDEDVLGLSLEERKALQQQAIDEDDCEWERELDELNRAKAGIVA
jgi:hypothetical protein